MNATELLGLLIRINRIFDAVACTWTGEAKQYAIELEAWSERHDWDSTPDLIELRRAIAIAGDRSLSWERRCIPLSNAMAPLETRLRHAIVELAQANSRH